MSAWWVVVAAVGGITLGGVVALLVYSTITHRGE